MRHLPHEQLLLAAWLQDQLLSAGGSVKKLRLLRNGCGELHLENTSKKALHAIGSITKDFKVDGLSEAE